MTPSYRISLPPTYHERVLGDALCRCGPVRAYAELDAYNERMLARLRARPWFPPHLRVELEHDTLVFRELTAPDAAAWTALKRKTRAFLWLYTLRTEVRPLTDMPLWEPVEADNHSFGASRSRTLRSTQHAA